MLKENVEVLMEFKREMDAGKSVRSLWVSSSAF